MAKPTNIEYPCIRREMWVEHIDGRVEHATEDHSVQVGIDDKFCVVDTYYFDPPTVDEGDDAPMEEECCGCGQPCIECPIFELRQNLTLGEAAGVCGFDGGTKNADDTCFYSEDELRAELDNAEGKVRFWAGRVWLLTSLFAVLERNGNCAPCFCVDEDFGDEEEEQ